VEGKLATTSTITLTNKHEEKQGSEVLQVFGGVQRFDFASDRTHGFGTQVHARKELGLGQGELDRIAGSSPGE